MKSTGTLVAERPLAQHSASLSARAPEPLDVPGGLASFATRFETALADELCALLGEKGFAATCAKVEKLNAAKLHKIVDLVAVNYNMVAECGSRVLASVDFTSALVLTDQLFGGPGVAPATLPERLPAAGNLALAGLANSLGAALGTAFEKPEALTAAARSDVLGKIIPAREPETLFVIRCEIERKEAGSWKILLALRESDAARLLGESDAPARATAPGDRRRPDRAPFADVPLTLTAVLAETRMPVGRISALKPGDILPLALRAQVPLRLGAVEIGRGEAGTDDGSLALRLTRIEWIERNTDNDG